MNLPAFTTLKGFAITGSLAVLAAILGVGEASQARSLPSSENQIENGVYLYGQVAQPNQISQGYVVFQNQNGQVIGAFYYPRSDFQCFAGNLDSTTLEVQPVETEMAVTDEMTADLDNLYPINSVSANDRRILSICQQAVASAPSPLAAGQ